MWILIIIAILALGYLLFVHPYTYWINKGVPQQNLVSLLGDIWSRKKSRSSCDQNRMIYSLNPAARYVGTYVARSPALVLRDPELIKELTVKEFDHFVDHLPFIPEGTDPLFATNLFSLTGQKWKDMRATVSPAFTSSKMKFMFSLISQSGEQFVKHFLKQNRDVITVEMKDIFTRFTNDAIANAAFGVEVDSLEQPKNEFYMMGKAVTNFMGFWKGLVLLGYKLIPQICRMFKIKFFPSEVRDFFNKLIKDNITSREKHGIVRPDIINLLMEIRKHGVKYEENHDVQDTGFATAQESEIGRKRRVAKLEIRDEDITAQALMFFFGGSDAVSSLMCFMSYELGIHPDVQEKLIQEIDDTFENCKGKLTYEAVVNMKYMDMVTSETLRKWPNAPGMDRVCTKPFTIEPKLPNEKPIHLKKGEVVMLPIYGLHMDPQHFPDPDRFDPERFSDENKACIKPYTFIPFGSGPRNCIGSRFALLETKTLFVYLLSHFEIVPIGKTQIPLQLSKRSPSPIAEGGFWLGLKRRVK